MSRPRHALRRKIATEAQNRCGYCQTQAVISGISLSLEHIFPVARGGSDEETNLWVSCRLCNEAKGVQVEALDPDTRQVVPLFHPRNQNWHDHFAWSHNGTHIIGLTSEGRATVVALNLNDELRLKSRKIWVEAGWHPPQ